MNARPTLPTRTSRTTRTTRGERGNGTLLVVIVSWVLVAVAAFGTVVGAYGVAAHRARGAADRAALHGAAAYLAGGSACTAAREQAATESHPISVEDCTVEGDAIDFVVSLTLTYRMAGPLRGLPDHVSAEAFAGPLAPGPS